MAWNKKIPAPLIEHIQKRIFYCPSGCWIWTGLTRNTGRPCISNINPKRNVNVARFMYEWHYKVKPPADLLVCHTCDVPLCVNPDHLWLGTHKDNVDDMSRKGREKKACGEAHFFSKLTEADVIEIRTAPKTIKNNVLAKKFNVKTANISAVRTGKSWKHIKIVSEWESWHHSKTKYANRNAKNLF